MKNRPFKSIRSNLQQILEILFLILIIFISCHLDFSDFFNKFINNPTLSILDVLLHIAVLYGKPVSIMITLGIALLCIRKINKRFVMNKLLVYHDYPFWWYWFCAKILGIKKCNLILVPIYMQYKLVINSVFDEYPLDDNDYPESDDEITIIEKNTDAGKNEINVILEDTYTIDYDQIPSQKRNLYTIKISRNNGLSNGRHFSSYFIESITNVIRKREFVDIINIYATTNPKNTLYIAKHVFALDYRGNINHLYVFQQKKDAGRPFSCKGHKIY